LAAGARTPKSTKRQHDEGEETEQEEESAQKKTNTMTGNPITSLGSISGMDLITIEQYQVPDNCVGLIIGRGGENISAIQNDSGCRIQMSQSTPVPDDSGRMMRSCTLTGSPISIEKAKCLMEAIIMKAGESLPPSRMTSLSNSVSQNGAYSTPGAPGIAPGSALSAKTMTVEVLIPGSKCGLVIGKGGEIIKSLEEKAGVKMVMIQENSQVSSTPKPLRIIGEPEKVEYAKKLVDKILNSKDDRIPPHSDYGGLSGNKTTGEIIVPKSAVGVIIGRNGEVIKRLTQDTGAKIQFRRNEDYDAPQRTAVITGTKEQIEKATQLITDLVNKNGDADVFYMHVPATKTGLVIGKGGETIKQISTESGARVELSRDPVPNDHEKVFVIKGTSQQIHHASHLIRIRVGDVRTPAAATDPNAAAWALALYAQYYPQNATVPYGQAYPTQTTAPVATTQSSTTVTPAINPQTGQPDYSAQWIEYYRSLGMHDMAAFIEQSARAYQQNSNQQQMTANPVGQ
ncbi:unnamed protein product, partial [Soboliphyme baturini]|uniref:KH domain-containing protein n=1 Tax=Soboliphyme baturini TaxID=241478 RepID=A0A183ICJ3_9BILA